MTVETQSGSSPNRTCSTMPCPVMPPPATARPAGRPHRTDRSRGLAPSQAAGPNGPLSNATRGETPMRRWLAGSLLALAGALVAASAAPTLAADKVVVASKIDTEGSLLGNMIALAL